MIDEEQPLDTQLVLDDIVKDRFIYGEAQEEDESDEEDEKEDDREPE